jgi:hypothetical protein
MVGKHFTHVVLQGKTDIRKEDSRLKEEKYIRRQLGHCSSDLEHLTKVRRCFPTSSNSCFSSQCNGMHDLDSFQGKSTKEIKKLSNVSILSTCHKISKHLLNKPKKEKKGIQLTTSEQLVYSWFTTKLTNSCGSHEHRKTV